MWVTAEYRPVALFSLKSGITTSSGAKTLFLPTPFAIRTALLDAAIRTRGLAAGKLAFQWIKSLGIAVRPPQRVAVTNLFTKVLKPTRKDMAEEAMDRTIAFREYAHFDGTLALAFDVADKRRQELQQLLPQVNYFGKRGSFFQLISPAEKVNDLEPGFVALDGVYVGDKGISGKGVETFVLGLIQIMDDWGDSLTFAKADVHTAEKIVLGKDRIRKSIILPYRLVRSSKGFSLYERV